MKLRIMSDIHLEFENLMVPVLEGEEETILVLAGDVGLARRPTTYEPFISDMAERFKAIIYIFGNHEHYNSVYEEVTPSIKEHLKDLTNVYILENETVCFDNTAFVCATLWTDYLNQNPHAMEIAGRAMNDHKHIRIENGGNFTPQMACEKHLESRKFIFDEIPIHLANGRNVVVVTHHCPSELSVHEKYRRPENTLINGAFYSSLDDLIIETQPDLWIHGHTHSSFDYYIENTRVLCNPKGYRDENKFDFDPKLTIEL